MAATAEANQKALATAGRLQLQTTQELNTRLETLINREESLIEVFQGIQEITENFIAGMSGLVERMDSQIEALIKLHSEMSEMVRVIYEAREQ